MLQTLQRRTTTIPRSLRSGEAAASPEPRPLSRDKYRRSGAVRFTLASGGSISLPDVGVCGRRTSATWSGRLRHLSHAEPETQGGSP